MEDYLLEADDSDASSTASSSSSSSSWGEMGLTLLDERDRQRLSSSGSQDRVRHRSLSATGARDGYAVVVVAVIIVVDKKI